MQATQKVQKIRMTAAEFKLLPRELQWSVMGAVECVKLMRGEDKQPASKHKAVSITEYEAKRAKKKRPAARNAQ